MRACFCILCGTYILYGRALAFMSYLSCLLCLLMFLWCLCSPQEAGVVKGKGPFAMCMAPTRELALQINEVR